MRKNYSWQNWFVKHKGKLKIWLLALLVNAFFIFSLPLWHFINSEEFLSKRNTKQKPIEAVKINLAPKKKKIEKIKPRIQKKETKVADKNQSLSDRFHLDLGVNQGAGVGVAIENGASKNIIFSQGEVEVDPIRVGGRNPIIPASFSDLGKNGKVDIETVIDENGNVIVANTVMEEPKGYGLKESVLSALKTWKFKPAMVNRIPVKVRVIIPFLF